MNSPEIFTHPLFGELPLLVVDEQEYFGATDVAKALSFGNPYDALKNHVDLDDLADHEVIDRLGRNQKKKFVTESGLYSLIFGAAKQGNNKIIQEKAKAFKRWVTSEVLPQIRKTGSYTNIPQTYAQALRLAADLEEEKLRIEQQMKIDAPFTSFGKTVSNSDGAISIGEFCKIVYEEHGINIGRNKMFAWFRNKGYLISSGREKNNPKQKYIQQGLFISNPVIVARSEGNVQEATTLITGKGQVYFVNKLLKQQIA